MRNSRLSLHGCSMDDCLCVCFHVCTHASVYVGGFCCYFGSQCPDQVRLSEPPLLLSKKTLAPSRLRKTPHPPKPPHVPFSCLRLLHSHDPLTKASSPVEYHMFLVKPNFFFSSFKTSICQAKSIEKAPLLPYFLPPAPLAPCLRIFQIAEVLN